MPDASGRPAGPASPPATAGEPGTHGTPAGSAGRVQTLERLVALRDSGAITSDEYQAEKTLVMNNGK